MSVLLGNGDGTFRPQQTYAVGSRPYSVAVADLNGDGKPDIVTANYGGNSVSVLLNNGDGTFGSQQTFATDLSPVQTVVADVNGDGRPDLVTVSNHDSAIGVLLGKGDGTFEPAAAGSGVGLSDTPFLADLNGDGIRRQRRPGPVGQHPFPRGPPRRRRHVRSARDPQSRAARACDHDRLDRLAARHRRGRRPLRLHAVVQSIRVHGFDLHGQPERSGLAAHRLCDDRLAHEPRPPPT